MRIALLGRTGLLLEAGRRLRAAGHEIPIVGTCRAEEIYAAGVDDFRAFAEEIGAAFFEDTRLHRPEILEQLRAAGCEVAVSVNWLTMVRAEVIDLFRWGVLNAHAGDLPRFRGNACPNWAILLGEPHVGLCVHQMDPDALDAGPIVTRARFPLTEDTYVTEVYAWLREATPALFLEAIDRLAAGEAPQPQPTDPALSLRCYPRRPEDSRVDWRAPAEEVLRLIRASSRPMLGAYAFLGDEKITLWRAERFEHPGPFVAMPGQVLMRDGGAPVVACGEGALRLTELEGAAGEGAARRVARSLRNRLT